MPTLIKNGIWVIELHTPFFYYEYYKIEVQCF